MSEFDVAIYYRYLHRDTTAALPKVTVDIKQSHGANTPDAINQQESGAEVNVDAIQQGTAFTKAGPAPYVGDILDDPELLWTDDVWNEDREVEAQRKLAEQGGSISGYWKNQYETKAGTFWHKFYKRNADHFYKDRHYLHLVFPELLRGSDQSESAGSEPAPLHLLEVGCGVGNAVLPLIEINPNIHVVAMDFARSAIEILNKHPFVLSCFDEDIAGPVTHGSSVNSNVSNGDSGEGNPTMSNDINSNSNSIAASSDAQLSGNSGAPPLEQDSAPELSEADVAAKRRVRTAVRCIVKDALPVGPGSMDLSLCMFVLSAIAPAEQMVALGKIAQVLKPGGKLLVRDYGRYAHSACSVYA